MFTTHTLTRPHNIQGTLEMLRPDLIREEFRDSFVRDLESAGKYVLTLLIPIHCISIRDNMHIMIQFLELSQVTF